MKENIVMEGVYQMGAKEEHNEGNRTWMASALIWNGEVTEEGLDTHCCGNSLPNLHSSRILRNSVAPVMSRVARVLA